MKSLVEGPKLDVIVGCISLVRWVPGNFAEAGVYHGGTLMRMAVEAPERLVYGFDTFAGMPDEMDHDGEPHGVGDFGDVDVVSMMEVLSAEPNVTLRQGIFPQSASGLEGERFALVHLDFDWYSSTAAAIEWFLPRMSRGGVMIFDDYDWPHTPGVRRAIEEAGIDVYETAPCQVIHWVR